MKILETVKPICIFCSFEAIVISSAGCESLRFLLKKNCQDVSKFWIANFLFQGDSSCQQKFFVTKVIHWLVGQKRPQWLLPATLYHDFHCSKLSYGQKWPAENKWIDGIHFEIGFWAAGCSRESFRRGVNEMFDSSKLFILDQHYKIFFVRVKSLI